jgi:hypothetical protein
MGSSKRMMFPVAFALLVYGSCAHEPPAREPAPAIPYPTTLAPAVRACCSAFRLARQEDVRGAWLDSDGEGSVPFFVEGDFNGDGAKDAAVLLIAGDGVGVELAVFEGGPQVYRLGHRRSLSRVDDIQIAAPQEVVLRLVRKGEEWAPEGGDVPQTYPHFHDAIAFETRKANPQGMVLAYAHLIYWNGKSYAAY